MSQSLHDVRQLRVFQGAYSLIKDIHQTTKTFPREERYALTDQIRRSSRSICSNLAEAWFKRRYPRAFVSKLSDAGGEASETLIWIDMAQDFGYLDAATADDWRNRLAPVIGGLIKMMASPEQWCIPGTVREPDVEYTIDDDI